MALLVIVIGFLPKALREPGLLDMPGVTPEQVLVVFKICVSHRHSPSVPRPEVSACPAVLLLVAIWVPSSP